MASLSIRYGSYSVKSGYWFVSNHPVIAAAPPTAAERNRIILKQRVWRIKTEPKIRLFWWRVIAGAIAVSVRLRSRGLNVDATCRLCQREEESINHIIFLATSAEILNMRITGRVDRWQCPSMGLTKCTVNANWRSAALHFGAAWIARESNGKSLFHARDALTHAPNRIVAELRTIIWALCSLRDLRINNVCIALDCRAAHEAISKPKEWPRFSVLLDQIGCLQAGFNHCSFEQESISANQACREISKSVLRDGRFQSYLAMGGPAWLHDILQRDSRGGT